MAYQEIKHGGIYVASGYEFVCDARTDISDLPKDLFGARALVIADGSVWILGSYGVWVEQG